MGRLVARLWITVALAARPEGPVKYRGWNISRLWVTSKGLPSPDEWEFTFDDDGESGGYGFSHIDCMEQIDERIIECEEQQQSRQSS